MLQEWKSMAIALNLGNSISIQNVVFLLGDAGTATIIEASPNSPEIKMNFKTDGSRKGNLIIPAGGFRMPSTSETRKIRKHADSGVRSAEHLCLDGIGVFNFSITDVVETIKEFMDDERLDEDSVDYLILHQANKFMIDKIAKKLSFPREKVLFDSQNSSSIAEWDIFAQTEGD